MTHHMIHVSGGKDSTALLLRALEHIELRPHFRPRAVFADTGHEHEWTLDHVRRVSDFSVSRGGPEVEWVQADLTAKFAKHRDTIRTKWPTQGVPSEVVERALAINRPTGNPFLDMCILHAGFPSSRVRFCTRTLKIEPTHRQLFDPLWKRGDRVISWRGIRADESLVRRTVPRIQTLRARGPLKGYHPLLEWTVADVWKMHEKHGLKPNDLYRHGMTRVGCFPCIMSKKSELRAVAERFPEAIEKLEEWERIVGLATKRDQPNATFFMVRNHRKGVAAADTDTAEHGIRDAVRWSKTTHGGKQYDLIPLDDIRAEFGTSCGEWGICE